MFLSVLLPGVPPKPIPVCNRFLQLVPENPVSSRTSSFFADLVSRGDDHTPPPRRFRFELRMVFFRRVPPAVSYDVQ